MGRLVDFFGSVRTLFVGSDREDFDLEVQVTPVEVRTTTRSRIVSAIWTMVTTVVAVTIAQVLIIPLFM